MGEASKEGSVQRARERDRDRDRASRVNVFRGWSKRFWTYVRESKCTCSHGSTGQIARERERERWKEKKIYIYKDKEDEHDRLKQL